MRRVLYSARGHIAAVLTGMSWRLSAMTCESSSAPVYGVCNVCFVYLIMNDGQLEQEGFAQRCRLICAGIPRSDVAVY